MKRTMKRIPPETEKDHGRDTKKFAQLPAKTKELELLQHEAEQSTGPASVVLNELIRQKSQRGDS